MKRFSACTNRAKRQKETTFMERKQKRLRTSFFVFLTSSLASAKSSTVVVVQLAEECTGFHMQMSSWEKDSRDWSRVHQRSKRKTWFAGRKDDTGRKRCERLEKKREEKEEKKAMKEMKRAEAAAKVDENQEYQKEKGVRQQDGNPWWSKRQLWQFGCRQQWLWIQGTQRNTDRTTIKIDLFASEAVRFGVLTVLRL